MQNPSSPNVVKIPVSRKFLKAKFPDRDIRLRKSLTSQGAPAVRLEIEGIPRGVHRDPRLKSLYREIDGLKQFCSHSGKAILY